MLPNTSLPKVHNHQGMATPAGAKRSHGCDLWRMATKRVLKRSHGYEFRGMATPKGIKRSHRQNKRKNILYICEYCNESGSPSTIKWQMVINIKTFDHEFIGSNLIKRKKGPSI